MVYMIHWAGEPSGSPKEFCSGARGRDKSLPVEVLSLRAAWSGSPSPSPADPGTLRSCRKHWECHRPSPGVRNACGFSANTGEGQNVIPAAARAGMCSELFFLTLIPCCKPKIQGRAGYPRVAGHRGAGAGDITAALSQHLSNKKQFKQQKRARCGSWLVNSSIPSS